MQAFNNWDTQPCATEGNRKLYYIPDVVDELVRRRCEETAKRVAADRQLAGGNLVSLDMEKTRLTSEQADKHALENAVRRAELLTAEGISRAWNYIIASVRAKLLSLPTKCAPELALMNDPGTIKERLTVELYGALEEASAYRPDHGIADDTEIDSSDAGDFEATTAVDGERVGGRAQIPI